MMYVKRTEDNKATGDAPCLPVPFEEGTIRDDGMKEEPASNKGEIDGFLTLQTGNGGETNSNGTKVDSHARSLIKGLTWRCLATATTTIIAWIVTGQVESALQIGLFEFFAKLLIYYLHERIWTRINL